MHEPKALADILREVDALRGYDKKNSRQRLAEAWRDVAGEAAAASHPTMVKSGVLHVAVRNAAVLDELANFRREAILAALRERHAGLKLRGLKFNLVRFEAAESDEDLGF